MDPRLAIEDEGAAQILGFIVGLAVVTASLAIASYFIVTVPESGDDQESQQLQGDTHRAAETLTTTPGEPRDWGFNFDNDTLRRVGLLQPGTHHYADRAKIDRIQENNLTASRILDSWDIDPDETGLRIEGRVQSVPIGGSPSVDSYGIAHAEASDSTLDWPIADHSKDAAQLYADINADYNYEPHFWEFDKNAEPDNGLGSTVPDHAYFVETQLLPMMAGIEATFSTADHGDGDWGNSDARMDAFDNYVSDTGQPESATGWHVAANKSPYTIPGNVDPSRIDDHVLTVNWHRENGNPENANGVGLWRVEEGARSTALLGGIEVDHATSGSMEFDHFLRAENSSGELCWREDQSDCTMIRPSILFWNTTDDGWSRLAKDADGCPASGWDDMGDAETTSNWDDASIDLCEALKHSGDKLWLSLFWDTDCIESGSNTTCSDNQAPHGWFVDNIVVKAGGSTVYETDFEPPTGRSSQSLFVSNGVDHNRTYEPAPDPAEENTVGYIRNMVQAGGNVLALSPEDAPPGEWLSQVGLASTATTPSDDVSSDQPSNIVLRYPNDLPETSADYRQENVSWVAGEPPTPSSWDLPDEFQELTAVQTGPDGEATLLQGKPYPDGGNVAAVSYNYTHFANETLREELWENLQGSSVFIDPTFEAGHELPEDGSSEVTSARRVLLVGVTPDNQYVVPLEVTVWMWKLG